MKTTRPFPICHPERSEKRSRGTLRLVSMTCSKNSSTIAANCYHTCAGGSLQARHPRIFGFACAWTQRVSWPRLRHNRSPLTRRLYVRPHYKLELVAEAFNALNRDNKRVVITDDGFTSTATDFVQRIRQLESSTFLPTTRSPRTWSRQTMRTPQDRCNSR